MPLSNNTTSSFRLLPYTRRDRGISIHLQLRLCPPGELKCIIHSTLSRSRLRQQNNRGNGLIRAGVFVQWIKKLAADKY